MQRLDPQSLRLFVRVAEEGRIALAAEREHIAAAAISKRISDMEELVGTALLLRTNKGVEPTAAGLELLALSRRALHELDQILEQMRSYSSAVRGLVRLCASTSAIAEFLSPEIKSFLALHPQVRVQVEERISTRVVQAVLENVADIGIFAPVPIPHPLQTYAYHADRLVLVVPRGHALARRRRVAFADALDEDFVGLHAGSAINLLLQQAANDAGRALTLRVQVTSFDALCTMVASGLGIGVLPQPLAERHAGAAGLRVVPLSDTWTRRDFLLGVRSAEALPTAARSLLAHLRAQVRTEPSPK
jgi:DNA-binding transcriptional LysR family regulator